MKAYLFSIGESTTDLAKWSLERAGLEVVMLYDPKTTFAQKYMEFLKMATEDGGDDVVRCDADVVVTKDGIKNLTDAFSARADKSIWWVQGFVYCYLKHDLVFGGPHLIKIDALRVAIKHIGEFQKALRPETELTRLQEFNNPRRFQALPMFTGIHGYRQRPEDIKRVMDQKEQRGQMDSWDMELINKLETL